MEKQRVSSDFSSEHPYVFPFFHKKRRNYLFNSFFLAGAVGIEPTSGVLETLILPMNYAPKCLSALDIYITLI